MKAILAAVMVLCVGFSALADEAAMTEKYNAEYAVSLEKVRKEYPDAFVEGSVLSKAISAEVTKLQQAGSTLLNDPTYPVTVARYVATQVGSGATHGASQFVVAVKEERNLRTSSNSKWVLEVGEVYRFSRYMSRSEAEGKEPTNDDRTYALLQIDQDTILVESSSIEFVPESDASRAAMAYNRQVLNKREFEAKTPADQSSRAASSPEPPPYRIISGSGPSRSGTSLRDSSGRIARSLEPGKVYHRRAVDDAEEAALIRRSQAMEAGAGTSELAAIDTAEAVREQTEELRRIRQIQAVQAGVTEY